MTPPSDDRSGAPPREALLRGSPEDGREGLNRPASVKPWRRTGNRTVLRDRWIHLRAEAWETPQGVTLDPWWMLDWAEWVHTIALTSDDRLVLVRQFRPGAQALTLELPGGIAEPGEAPLAAAQREFAEETGFTAASWQLVSTLPPEPAHSSNHIHFVLAQGCIPAGAQVLDAGEDIRVETHPVAEVLAGLAGGLMQNAMHVGGLLLGLRAAGRIGW